MQTVACVGALCLALAGCGKANQDTTNEVPEEVAASEQEAEKEEATSAVPDGKQIKDNFTEVFDSAFNPEYLKSMVVESDEGNTMLEAIGMSVDEYCELAYKLVVPTVKDIEIDGDEAVLTVELKTPDWDAAEEQGVTDQLLVEKSAGLEEEELTEEQMTALFAEVVRESMSYPTMPSKTEEFEIPYERVNGVWQPADVEDIEAILNEVTESL